MIEIGNTVNGYKITDLINNGGFCNAFRVSKDGKSYFLKEYTDPTKASSDFDAFLDNQKKILSTLRHLGDSTENIVEHFVYDGHYYQVKELLSGCDMSDWMNENGEYEDRLEAALQLANIIKTIHAAGIVHQDLKPEQVMVVSEHPLKLVLTDFDWSVIDGKIVRYVGTPWYKYIDGSPSEKTDIFTFGIIMYVLLTGYNPYQDNGDVDDDNWPRWVKGRMYVDPIERNPDDITKKLNQMIISCLSPEPSERPSIDDVISVLENPKDIKRMVSISCGKEQMIIPVGATADRRDFKLCFPDTTDREGNPIYMYISHEITALKISLNDEELVISSPDAMLNKFKLNGKELTATPVQINDGDTLELFSTKRSETIATFKVVVK